MQKYLIVPITVYEGNVEILDKSQIHPLHRFLLKYICAEHNMEKVIKAFSLDNRIIEEAIIDLMYKEFVFVDFENAVIYPSAEIAEVVDEGRLESYLELSYPSVERIKWVQDNITGQICMYDDVDIYLRKPLNLYSDSENYNSQDRITLNSKEFLNIKLITPETLIKIGKMTLREYINEGSIFEQIKRISNLHAIDNRTLYIPTKSEEIQGIIYDLPVSECIPSEIIESWSHSITQLDKYSINDLSKADEEFLSNFHWDFLIQKWDNFLGNFGTILSDNIEKQLQFQKIGDIINFLTYEGIPRLLPKMQEIGLKVDMVHQQFLSGMEILEKLETRMKMAKELIIIGSAFIKNDSIQQLTTIIQNLPIKYLKLVLIWGGLGEESPDVFKEITSIVDQSIILIKGKDLFHSKFLIIDNQIGWITSCNLLSYYYSEKSPEECICEFERGLIINDIVEYIRQLIPENSTALEWIDKTYDKYEVDPDSINTYSTFSNFHNYLENVLESLQAIRNKSNFSENLLKLKDLFENIKKSLRFFRNKETAVLIENLDHRKLLRSVLSECSSQIKIGTDRIIQNAISPVLISAFNDALARNVSISIKWGKENPKGTKKDQYEISLKGLQYLNEQTNNMLSIPQSPCHSHSKYLIMDESLSLITSYNLLAFSGNGLADDDITKELGVVITSRKITKNILDYC